MLRIPKSQKYVPVNNSHLKVMSLYSLSFTHTMVLNWYICNQYTYFEQHKILHQTTTKKAYSNVNWA